MQIDDSRNSGRAEKASVFKRRALTAAGMLCVISGVIGVFVPVWPTTPFLLAAALLFGRSSPRLHAWLTRNEYLGSFIRNYREKCGVPRRIIFRALLFLWLALGISIFFTGSAWVRLLLCGVGIAVSVHLLCIRRSPRPPLRFTLIELLVSLGVIALLASMLFPVLNRARAAAMRSVCANNLKQIGTAVHMYANSNADFIPALAPGFDGSCMILRMPGAGLLGLGRLVGNGGTSPRNYGCPLNQGRTGDYVGAKWPLGGFVQAAYLYRNDDAGFETRLSAAANCGKAMVMDFCCVISGADPIVAHSYEDVNILYSDGSVRLQRNSPIPGELFTVSAPASMFGGPVPECTVAWENADRL